ncbi:PepSY-associated TM helix domain-containing protein [Sphingomonas gei]|uniref:PepSY-associated TM helix domain-containing protein n=1 Tax=Sphingomonas gei TaxID=1395960 RepID=UPI0014410AFD|nr:PepSY-associated TM helix domain-containing protein [Sphingomonas gei]
MNGPEPKVARRKLLLSPGLVGAVLAGHSAVGLALAALIYLVCLSGSLAVFAQELQRWEQPAGPVLESVAPRAVDEGFNAIRAKAPTLAKKTVSIELPSAAVPRLTLSAGGDEGVGGEKWLADAAGRPAARIRRPTSDFIVALHTGLLLPEGIGRTLVGLIGIALLALLLSGVLAHPRMIKDAFTLRRGGSWRLQQADLHNRLGTWGLPFYLTVTLTGVFLGLFFVIFASLAATAYKGDLRHAFSDMGFEGERPQQTAAAVPSMSAMIEVVRAKAPEASIRSVSIERAGTSGQKVNVTVHRPGQLSTYERYVFDTSGRMVDSPKATGETISRQILFALQPLHFGWFGGIVVKAAYGLLGLALCVMTSSGVTIWLARRRDKGRPAPMWERIWTATIWGQPVALALAAAVPVLWRSETAAAMGWAAGAASAFALACLYRNDRALALTLRLLTAVLLVALAVTHGVVWSRQMEDSAGWIVDAVLIVGAAVLAAPLSKRAAARPS